jgi:plasmid stability protein
MTTLTIKNIPDDLYERLKRSAQVHHRSLNSELLYYMESVLKPTRLTAQERIQRIRALRPSIKPDQVTTEEIEDAINQGRP